MSRPGQPPGPPQQQPLSFKTVPGRHRTQKWQQAKTYNYDGDDWGGYDPYDEYGGNEDPPPLPPQTFARPHRMNSFDAGEEKRAFSAGAVPSGVEGQGNGNARPAHDHTSHTRPRDFTNPEQVPPPLNTRLPGPASADRFPPRKSSIGDHSPASAANIPLPQSAAAMKTEKPLPFIRPSDIYRRMAEEQEREKQSVEISQSAADSTRAESTPSPAAIATGAASSKEVLPPSTSNRPPSLDPVDENKVLQKKHDGPAAPPAAFAKQSGNAGEVAGIQQEPENGAHTSLPTRSGPQWRPQDGGVGFALPPVSRLSGFGSDFLSSPAPDRSAQIPLEQPSVSSSGAESIVARVFNAPLENATQSGTSGSPQLMPVATSSSLDQGSAAERQHSSLAMDSQVETDLQHQPSTGFRSVVHTAFDRKDDSSVPPTPTSRNSSHSSAVDNGVTRSNTTSTSSISPIMSHIPLAATMDQRQQERDMQVPPIAEEPVTTQTPTQSRPGSRQILRKPSPGQSRSTSAELAAANVQPGYRRSLDPPSSDNSPLRTTNVEAASDRELVAPMAAAVEASDIPDQAAEVSAATLVSVGMAPSETAQAENHPVDEYVKELPISGRGRSGTNYSIREADLAQTVNASPEEPSFSPIAAEAEQASREQFLRMHAGTPTLPASPAGVGPKTSVATGLGISRTGTPTNNSGSGRNSPVKGRVREIAGKYQDLDELSRRDSETSLGSRKSSWSNFRGSEENLAGLKRKDTAGITQAVEPDMTTIEAADNEREEYNMVPEHENAGNAASLSVSQGRPELESQQSFRPHLPGEWVSAAPTPADEEPPESRPILSRYSDDPQSSSSRNLPIAPAAAQEEVEITPTTRKTALQAPPPDFTPDSSNASRTSDLTQQVRDAGAALGASLMATAGLTSQSRDFASQGPTLETQQPSTQVSDLKTEDASSLEASEDGGATDIAGSAMNASGGAPLRSRQEDLRTADLDGAGHPSGGYFANTAVPPPTPLKLGPQSQSSGLDGTSPVVSDSQRRSMDLASETPTSLASGGDDTESDRLRDEIVRSLDPVERAREQQQQNTERIQDALDAPENARRIVQGQPPKATTEAGLQRPQLPTRFSWEQPAPQSRLAPIEEPQSPEVKPEMPYERPQNKGLRIVNAELSDSEPEEEPSEDGSETQVRNEQYQQQRGSVRPQAANETLTPQRELHDMAALTVGAAAVAAVSAGAAAHSSNQGPVSPVSSLGQGVAPIHPTIAEREAAARGEGSGMMELAPSPLSVQGRPVSEALSTPRLPSYYGAESITDADRLAGNDVHQDAAHSSPIPGTSVERDENLPLDAAPQPAVKGPRPQSSGQGQRIPPFREILAIKEPADRIKNYNSTRETFAGMDTGLGDWVRRMLTEHPEHRADLAALPSVTGGSTHTGAVGSTFSRHKHSPSIIKFTKGFSNDSERKASGPSFSGPMDRLAAGEDPTKDRSSNATSLPADDSRRVDVEKMQQKGKDLLKNAGALSGKMQDGAKGLFAKGKSRFGGKRDSGEGEGKAPLRRTSLTSSPPISLPLSKYNPNISSPSPLAFSTTSSLSDDAVTSQTTSVAAPPASSANAGADSTIVHSFASSSRAASPPAQLLGTLTPVSAATTTSVGLQQSSQPQPLSRTFSRLRKRSRSRSRESSGSRNRSRPASWAFLRKGSSAQPGPEISEEAHSDVGFQSLHALPVGLRGGGMELDGRRREAWEGDDVEIPRNTSQEEGGTFEYGSESMARLGVLPNPPADTASVVDESRPDTSPSHQAAQMGNDGEPVDGRVSDMGLRTKDMSSGDDDREVDEMIGSADERNANLDEVPSGVRSWPPIEGLALRTVTDPATVTPDLEPAGTDHPPAPAETEQSREDRPRHQRKVSDLASLPSQRRALEMSPRSPSFGTRLQADHDAENPYSSTPTTIRASASAAYEYGDDENLYHATPRATGPPRPWEREAEPDPQTLGVDTEASKQDTLARRPASGSETTHLVTPASGIGFDVSRSKSARSDVSAQDGVGKEIEGHAVIDALPADSPRSSVSSLGGPDTVVQTRSSTNLEETRRSPTEPSITPPVMTAQAIPAGPIGIGGHIPTHRDETPQGPQPSAFANRSYKWPSAQQSRPMSYTPLGRDASGAPIEETLNATNEAPPPMPVVDLSALSGPPAGTPPFGQHPVLRDSVGDVEPSEYEELHARAEKNATPPVTRDRQVSEETSGRRKSRRFSGFFRGSNRTSEVPDVPTMNTSAAHNVDTQYGREGQALAVGSVESQLPPSTDDKKNRRRSSIWGISKRSPSVSRPASSRNSSMAILQSQSSHAIDPASTAPNQAKESMPRPKTLQKQPQRAASAATPKEPNKKAGFSRLGSLFGRSGSTGHGTPRSNKLTKAQQPIRENLQKTAPPVTNSGTITGVVGNYEAYEAIRRQQILDMQRGQSGSPHMPAVARSNQPLTAYSANTRALSGPLNSLPAPPEGWYGPKDDEHGADIGATHGVPGPADGWYGSKDGRSPPGYVSPPKQSSAPLASQPAPFRRLHSQGQRREALYVDIPEAFRPVDASYGVAVAPIGPPPDQASPAVYGLPTTRQQPTLPTQHASWDRGTSMPQQPPLNGPPYRRQSSYDSTYQLSSQSAFQNFDWAPSPAAPTTSLDHSRRFSEGFQPGHPERVVSTDHEIARSPAREYADQQTPWAVSLPPVYDEEPLPNRRPPSWANQNGRAPYQPTDQPHPARYGPTDPSYGPGMYHHSPELDIPPRPPPQQTGPRTTNYRDVQLMGRRANPEEDAYPYPTPPYSPAPTAPYHYRPSTLHRPPPPPPQARPYSATNYSQPPPAVPQQRRYYTSPDPQPYGLNSSQHGRPLTYQRSPSGYSGRRDDMAVGEEELIMRGVSYPGQEWSP